MKTKVEVIKSYSQILKKFVTDSKDFAKVLHPDFSQRQFPNVLNKNGQESNFEQIVKRAEMGSKILSSLSAW